MLNMNKIHSYMSKCLQTGFFFILLFTILASSTCICEAEDQEKEGKPSEVLKYKLAAIAAILVASALGVSLPFLVKNISRLQPDGEIFLLVKIFAAGVILATGLIHILPDAFDSLTSPCLGQNPWHGFPFTGFVAMMAAIGTLMMESFATGYRKRIELSKAQPLNGEEDEEISDHGGGVHGGHLHGSSFVLERTDASELVRHRIVSQVLELGILVHSVIIGISLGASVKPKTVKPLVAALTFHQFFEGMGLGGCISQAKFKYKAMAIMFLFFSITTPTGIAVGIGISSIYNRQGSTALIVQGLLNSASAGILIYMALVDLLANDFMNPKMLSNFRLQLGANFILVLGASFMSVLAIWL